MGISDEFRTRWAAHNVRIHHGGVKRFHHPDAGFLELTYQPLDLPVPAHEAHSMTFYTAEPGTAYEDRLKLRASWAASGPEAVRPVDGVGAERRSTSRGRAGPAPMRMVGGPCSCAPLSGPCEGRTTREITRCARGAHTPRVRRTSRTPGTTPGRPLGRAHAVRRHPTPSGAASRRPVVTRRSPRVTWHGPARVGGAHDPRRDGGP
ncbi:hypothetical protein ABT116_29805 [Streptomyces sp. NPDC002130]|uniref:MmyB family transcriptional regulator n=1 Tax=Streptomyces sp. NPDC002130 TaxID=3155568 RepID=UPI0033220F15